MAHNINHWRDTGFRPQPMGCIMTKPYLFEPIPDREVARIRPADKSQQRLVTGYESSQYLRDAGFQVGDVVNMNLTMRRDDSPAGTHDGIRDSSFTRAQWGWEYTLA